MSVVLIQSADGPAPLSAKAICRHSDDNVRTPYIYKGPAQKYSDGATKPSDDPTMTQNRHTHSV